jgi:hemoglobin
MTPETDVTFDDIKLLVRYFCSKVSDEFIGPIFNEKIGDPWPEHLEKNVSFLANILLE